MKRLTVCSYHVTYAFQSESTLYSCLNVKELLAQNRHKIRSLSDCNWTRTRNHLVCKQTFDHEKVGLLLVVELAIMNARKNIWCILQCRIIHEQQKRRKCCFLINYLILRQRQKLF